MSLSPQIEALLDDRDWEVIRAIQQITDEWSGSSPGIGDIVGRTGIPRTTIYGRLCKMKGYGLLTWEPGGQRTLRMLREV